MNFDEKEQFERKKNRKTLGSYRNFVPDVPVGSIKHGIHIDENNYADSGCRGAVIPKDAANTAMTRK